MKKQTWNFGKILSSRAFKGGRFAPAQRHATLKAVEKRIALPLRVWAPDEIERVAGAYMDRVQEFPGADRFVEEWKKKPELDYFILSHFHGDHMGDISRDSEMSGNGAYKLSGITKVGDLIPIHKILDRGWSDYNYPRPLENDLVKNYRSFSLKRAASFNISSSRVV
ncbi:MAG: hypothetical protein GWP06_03825 [Actinobacteria bacterium]|nr:hypothetical protein [Actinomycetota bacterium]